MKFLLKALSAVVCICTLCLCTSCTSDMVLSEYPVNFGGQRFDVAPNNILCLSRQVFSAADYLGYSDRCLTGDYGTDDHPDYDAILNAAPEVVITANDFIFSQKDRFDKAGIKICKQSLPQTLEEYKNFLTQLGSFFGGNKTGKAAAQKVVNDIDESVNNVKEFANTKPDVSYLVFYEEGKCAANGDYLIDLLENCGLNGYNNQDYFTDDRKIISANPQVIICTEALKDYFKQEQFAQCDFYKNNAVYVLDISEATSMGANTLPSIYKLFEQMYQDFLNEGKKDEV